MCVIVDSEYCQARALKFWHADRHLLSRAGRVVQSFEPEFSPL